MVLIFKDLTNYVRISCIPADSLEPIKDWLDQVDIVFSEETLNLNWPNILTEIRTNLQSFLDQDGWGFLQEANESEGEQSPNDEDSNFVPEEEESDSDDESEYSVHSERSEPEGGNEVIDCR